ncbi:MAG: PAS domain-containing protein [Deltaproteobacteria bacterium]|nr:PAS domain-containing protein [Deltaproteobacteria bacterium]
MRNDTLTRIIDAIPNSVTVINDDCSILAANKTARQFIGVEGLGVNSFKCHKVIRNSIESRDGSKSRCPIEAVLSTGTTIMVTHNHCIDEDLILEIHVAPFKKEEGKTVQLVMSCRDFVSHEPAEETPIMETRIRNAP